MHRMRTVASSTTNYLAREKSILLFLIRYKCACVRRLRSIGAVGKPSELWVPGARQCFSTGHCYNRTQTCRRLLSQSNLTCLSSRKSL